MTGGPLNIADEILDSLYVRVNLLDLLAIEQGPAVISHFVAAHGRVDICGEMIGFEFTGPAESPGRQFGSLNRENAPSEIEMIFERPRIQFYSSPAGSGASHIIGRFLMDLTE